MAADFGEPTILIPTALDHEFQMQDRNDAAMAPPIDWIFHNPVCLRDGHVDTGVAKCSVSGKFDASRTRDREETISDHPFG